MIKSSIEKLAEEIGFDIGTSDDLTQVKLLNGFCKGIANSIINDHDLDLQICYIVNRLDNKAEKILSKLVDFINHKNSK